MTIDASRNPVTFSFGPGGTLTAEFPARLPDGVRRAWRTVAEKYGARPEMVTAISCRWQPSVMDARYIELTFDDVDVTYEFDRPTASNWDVALTGPTRTLDTRQHPTTEDRSDEQPTVEPARGGDRPGELLPVVHSMSLPAGRELWETVPAFAVIDEGLFATLARIRKTSDGTLTIQSVRWDEISGHDEFLALAKDAAMRLMAGLSMEATTSGGKTTLVRVRHDEHVAGSAIALASLHDTILERYGWEVQLVAIPDPHEMVIMPAESPDVDKLWALVRDADRRSATFRPTLIRLTGVSREILLEGGPAPDPGEDLAANRSSDVEVEKQLVEQAVAKASWDIMESTKDAPVLPVLRSTSLPSSGWIKETRPYWPVVGDAIYATLARVALTPRGTVGMGHILDSQVTDDEDFARQAAEAIAAVMDDLVLESTEENDGDAMCRMYRRNGFLAAGAICLPNFHEWISQATGWPELIIAINCPDHIYLAQPGTPAAELLRETVAESAVEDRELRPTLLRCTAAGFELLLESKR